MKTFTWKPVDDNGKPRYLKGCHATVTITSGNKTIKTLKSVTGQVKVNHDSATITTTIDTTKLSNGHYEISLQLLLRNSEKVDEQTYRIKLGSTEKRSAIQHPKVTN